MDSELHRTCTVLADACAMGAGWAKTGLDAKLGAWLSPPAANCTATSRDAQVFVNCVDLEVKESKSNNKSIIAYPLGLLPPSHEGRALWGRCPHALADA